MPALAAAEALPLRPDFVAHYFLNSATEVPSTPLNYNPINRSIWSYEILSDPGAVLPEFFATRRPLDLRKTCRSSAPLV